MREHNPEIARPMPCLPGYPRCPSKYSNQVICRQLGFSPASSSVYLVTPSSTRKALKSYKALPLQSNALKNRDHQDAWVSLR